MRDLATKNSIDPVSVPTVNEYSRPGSGLAGNSPPYEQSLLANHPSHQVIFLCFFDQHVHNLTGLRNHSFWRIIDQNTAIDIRSLSFHSSLPQQFAFIRFAFKQNAYRFTNARSV